ncbi:MAG TPA: hypothetical protein VF771_04220 [Longimicrobiaceae bacterium]
MGKKKLRIDDLRVESFHVLPGEAPARGTVEGREIILSAYNCSGTCLYVNTCKISCPEGTCIVTACAATCDTCADTCDTCDRTCAVSCEGTCDTCLCTYPLDFCEFQ